MDVLKIIQVLADQKQVKETVVQQAELFDLCAGTRIEHGKTQMQRLAGLRDFGRHVHFQVELFGNARLSGNQRHGTTRTLARLSGAVIQVHRTGVKRIRVVIET